MSDAKQDGKAIRGIPLRPFLAKWAPRLFAAGLLGSLAYVARKAMRVPLDKLDTFAGAPLKTHFMGTGPIDGLLARLVSAFSFCLEGGSHAARVQLIYLTTILGAAVIVWIVEGYRRDNRTATFQAAYQIFGVGLVAPIYYSLSILSDKGVQTYQAIPVEMAYSILPAFIIGYALPTAALAVSFNDKTTMQNVIAAWQPAPVFVAMLVPTIANWLKLFFDQRGKRFGTRVDRSPQALSNALKTAYTAAFEIFAIAHIGLIFYIRQEPDLSVKAVFCDVPWPFDEWDLSDPTSAMFIFMKFDLIFYVASTLIHLLYIVADMRLKGSITTNEALCISGAVLVGQILVGPAATYVGVWHWREGLLANVSKGDAVWSW